LAMVKIKEMPVKEKYDLLTATIKQDSFTPLFIGEHLGNQAQEEYGQECQKVSKAVPENAPDKEKYEIDYGNWVSTGGVAFDFIKKRMGEEGLQKYIKADVEEIKKANASPALILLKMIKFVSPGTAFLMMAKRMAYQLQWITAYSVTELSRNKVVMEIPHCKVLDYPGSEGSCLIGCQKIYEIWLAEQFQLEMKTKRKGYSCTLSIAPIK
jgi:hypothetical protein